MLTKGSSGRCLVRWTDAVISKKLCYRPTLRSLTTDLMRLLPLPSVPLLRWLHVGTRGHWVGRLLVLWILEVGYEHRDGLTRPWNKLWRISSNS